MAAREKYARVSSKGRRARNNDRGVFSVCPRGTKTCTARELSRMRRSPVFAYNALLLLRRERSQYPSNRHPAPRESVLVIRRTERFLDQDGNPTSTMVAPVITPIAVAMTSIRYTIETRNYAYLKWRHVRCHRTEGDVRRFKTGTWGKIDEVSMGLTRSLFTPHREK